MNVGLYIHIPFCLQKCFYCDFPSYSGLEFLYADYIAALDREIADQGGLLSNDYVDSIFIGGGTPTILPAGSLTQIMDTVHKTFRVAANAEITVEANPGTMDHAKLLELRQCGINRISFGVQSFSNPILSAIGRIHTAEAAVESIAMAQACGFDNVNIDLMYGIPSQTVSDLQASLNTAYELKVQHLSVYGLKVESGTAFADWQNQGILRLPDEDEEETMYDQAVAENNRHGFLRYEVSNFAQPGYECRHNLKYWHFNPYIGFGSAAHSFVNGVRRANVTSVSEYVQRIRTGRTAVESVECSENETAMAEFSFLALRTVRGLSIAEFNRRFNNDFLARYTSVIEKLKKLGLIEFDGRFLRLTERGMKFGNQVFQEFIL
jgi:oxygen-independent coproporphyrinogen-3 oxidase